MIRSSVCLIDVREYEKPLEQERELHALLIPEVIQKIFSYMNPRDIQAASGVCPLWGEMTVALAMHENYNSIKKAAAFFYKHLHKDSYSVERKKLLNLSLSEKPYVENLIEVGASLDTLAEHILFQLKKIARIDLVSLTVEVEACPLIIQKLVKVAEIYQDIDETAEIGDDNLKYTAIKILLRRLGAIGHLKKMIEIANLVQDDDWRAALLYEVFEKLIGQNKVFKALEIAHSMPNDEEDFRGQALDKIINILIERMDFDAALKIANGMSDEDMKEHYTNKITQALNAKSAQG